MFLVAILLLLIYILLYNEIILTPCYLLLKQWLALLLNKVVPLLISKLNSDYG